MGLRLSHPLISFHPPPDTPFIQLPDALFNLSVLTILKIQPEDDRLAALSCASRHFKNGCDAVKRLKRWMPGGGYEVSQKLAKGLLRKYAKAIKQSEKGNVSQAAAASKKDD